MTQIRLTLPDDSVREVPAGTTGRELAAGDRPGPGQGGAGGPGRRRRLGPRPAASSGDAAFAILTDRDADCARRSCATPPPTSWPRRCGSSSRTPTSASARRSRTASTTTSRCPGRSRRRTSRRSRPKMAEVVGAGPPLRARGGGPGRGQPALCRRPAQARADQRARRRRGRSPSTPTGRSSISAAGRTSRAPAGSSTSSCCTARAPTGAATSAARCCSGSTARRGSRRRTSTPTSTGSRRRGSATTAGSAGSSTCSCSTRRRRAPRSGPTGARRSTTRVNDYMRELQRGHDYQEIKTPLLYNKGLWERSGHWGKYRENMFMVLDNESGEHDISLKPMNCPSHHLLYGMRKHSYRELPMRYSTYDVLHRNEVSGALSGLTRVRQFPQDDCHIYLPPGPDRGRGARASTQIDPRRTTPTFGLDGHAEVRHPAGAADRRRRDVGPRRGGAPGARWRRPGCPTS